MPRKSMSRNAVRAPKLIAQIVAELLEGVAVGEPSQGDQMATLRNLEAEWHQATGDRAGVVLFRFTKAALGAVRASSPGDRIYSSAYASLVKATRQWCELAADVGAEP